MQVSNFHHDKREDEHPDDGSNESEDCESLLPNKAKVVIAASHSEHREWLCKRRSFALVVAAVAMAMAAVCGFILGWGTRGYSLEEGSPGIVLKEGEDEVNQFPYQFTCPDDIGESQNDEGMEDFYDTGNGVFAVNKTLTEMKLESYDGWNEPFYKKKESFRPWKELAFVPNLKSGDLVYESACGIGFNMLLTAEILQENGISNLTFYGNDYVHNSVVLANRIWDDEEVLPLARKGKICRGDSSNLDFVSSSAFDFVYTGYIDPIMNPLHVELDDDGLEYSTNLCKSSDEKDVKQAEEEQASQEAWYRLWVEELIRIAKPGKVIAIESGAESICTLGADWGGVDKSWWAEAIGKYGWDVDPGSLFVQDGDHGRYHTMMRKLNPTRHV